MAQPQQLLSVPVRAQPFGAGALEKRKVLRVVDDTTGVESLAAALSEERGTLEDVIEPYLIQQGFLVRTARGRMASQKAYRHLGLKPKPGMAGLFAETPDA